MRAYGSKVLNLSAVSVAVRCAVVLLLLSGLQAARAQQDETPKRGFQPTSSYAITDIETINTTNGNMILRVPMAALPAGRGGNPGFTLNLLYNSKLWDSRIEINYSYSGGGGVSAHSTKPQVMGTPYTMNILQAAEGGGWGYGMYYTLEELKREDQYADPVQGVPQCPSLEAIWKWKLRMRFPDGSVHEFRPMNGSDYHNDGYYDINHDGWSSSCGPSGGGYVITSGMTYYSTDGTYMRLEIGHDGNGAYWDNPWTLFMPDGTRVVGGNQPQRIYDRNDNYIEWQHVTLPNGNPAIKIVDQLGRSITKTAGANPDEENIIVSGTDGHEVVTTVKWKPVWVYKKYNATSGLMPPGVDPFRELISSQWVVERITLPSQSGGMTYNFDYSGGATQPLPGNYTSGWGDLKQLTMPTGARADYQYQTDGMNMGFYQEALHNHPISKTLTYRQEYDGVAQSNTPCASGSANCTTETWTYATSPGIGIVVAPDGGVTKDLFFDGLNGSLDAGLVYKSVRPDGTVIERTWMHNTPHGTKALNQYVKTEYTSITDAAGNLSKTAIKDYDYDKNGNIRTVREYDWVPYSSVPRDSSGRITGLPAGIQAKRVTTNTYYNPAPLATDNSAPSPYTYNYKTTRRLITLPASTEVSAGGSAPLTRTEYFYDDINLKGNLLEQRSWDSTKNPYSNPLSTGPTGNNSISVSYQYDAYGNLTLSTDARGYQTQYLYGAINGFTDLYPTEVKSAYGTSVQLTTKQEYDFYTGLPTLSTDANNVQTRIYYDDLGRPTLVKAAVGKPEEVHTHTLYDDPSRKVIVRASLNTMNDWSRVSLQHFDQLGRVRLTRQLENPQPGDEGDETKGIKVQTRYAYSGVNSYQLVSNPYRAAYSSQAGSEPAMGWTRSKSDKAGRVVEVQTFSGNSLPAPWGNPGNTASTGTVVTAYDGEFTTVTDQSERARRSMTNALGKLVRVDEPGDINNPANLGPTTAPLQATGYTYDALGNLTGVAQGAQTRTFQYTSLSRLLSATNPESGTIQYEYDANGNLATRTDARGVVTSYGYDPLNRITTRTYSDTTPAVTYAYDTPTVTYSKGRLTSVTSTVSTTSYTQFDSVGRVRASSQTTSGAPQSYSMTYTYDLAGNLKSETYPSGRVVESEYDTEGRLAGVKRQNGGYYAGGASTDTLNRLQYTAYGALASLKLGNGLWEHTSFNSRLQPTEIGLGTTSADSSKLQLQYSYGTTNNNGNVQSQTILAPGMSVTQSYSYDHLNRLKSFQETGGAGQTWNQVYLYDRYGNRNIDTAQTTHHQDFLGENPTFDTNNNRIASNQGYLYDSAGNLTQAPNNKSYSYDAENKQTVYKEQNVEKASYSYDGDGRRVKKIVNGVMTIYVYDASGQLVAEYGGEVVNNGTRYLTSDHLGSTRLISDGNGIVKERHDYLPFGEELGSYASGRSAVGAGDYKVGDIRQKFTQKERDSETGLDYFLARYYSSTQGRFTGVDPENAGAMVGDPQSWNAYSYVLNNPCAYIDPTGREWVTNGAGRYIWIPPDEYEAFMSNPENALNWAYVPSGTRIGRLGNVGGSSDPAWNERNRALEGEEVYLGSDGNFQLVHPEAYEGIGLEIARQTAPIPAAVGVFMITSIVIGGTAGAGAYYGAFSAPWLAGARPLSVTGPSRAITFLSKVSNSKLRNIINDLYKWGSKIGDGGTADAITFTKETGKLVGGSDHIQKGMQYSRALEKLLKSGRLNQSETEVAKTLLKELQRALSK